MDVAEDDNPLLTQWLQSFSHERISESTIFFLPSDFKRFGEAISTEKNAVKKISASLPEGSWNAYAFEKLAKLAVHAFLLFSSNILPEEERLFEVMKNHLKTRNSKIDFVGEPFLYWHENSGVNVIIQPIFGVVMTPEIKKALGHVIQSGYSESYAEAVIRSKFGDAFGLPDDRSKRVFFALDNSKLQKFSEDFGFDVNWNLQPVFKRFRSFMNVVPFEVQQIMLMSGNDIGVDPLNVKDLTFKGRDGKSIWILDVGYTLNTESTLDNKYATVYYVNRLPTLVLKAIASRIENLTGKKNFAPLGKDVFTKITSGDLKGKDLFRACNTSSEINRYCNADDQLVFRNAIFDEFQLKLPRDVSSVLPFPDPRSVYKQLHTFYVVIFEDAEKNETNRYSIALIKNGSKPQNMPTLGGDRKSITLISSKSKIYYDRSSHNVRLFYIDVVGHPGMHFVGGFGSYLLTYGMENFAKVDGFDEKRFSKGLWDTLKLLHTPFLTSMMFGKMLYELKIYPIKTVFF